MVWRDTTANVRKDLNPAGVLRCSQLIGANSDAAGMQEIENAEHHTNIKKFMPEKNWWWNDAKGREDVQAFRKSGFRPADDSQLPAWASPFEVIHMSDPMGVGVNPTRYASFSWMIRQFPGGHSEAALPAVWIDAHTVNGAFSRPGEAKEALRIPRFEQFMKNLNARIDKIQGLGDVPIILKGDWNATPSHLRHYLPEATWLWDSGIDNIGLINAPKGHQIRVIEGSLTELVNPSDHQQRTVLLAMSGKPVK